MARLFIILALFLPLLAGSSSSLIAKGAVDPGEDAYILSWINKLVTKMGVYFWDPNPSRDPVLAVNNLQPVSLENAKRYVYFDFASYCQVTLETWSCPDCVILGSNVTYISKVENTTYNTLAFFAVDESRSEIILTYRGTFNLANVLTDLSLFPVSVYNDPSIKVHKGFYDALQSLHAGIIEGLDRLIAAYPSYKVVVTGHSLGGAMAALTLFEFKHYGLYTETQFELYTYGEPRHGNLEYATKFNSFNFPAARVVNRADIVPHLVPFFLGYVHRGNEVFAVGVGDTARNCSNDHYEDMSCSNSQGPLYSGLDHFVYFDAEVTSCLIESPINLVLQFIVNLIPIIPPELLSLLQLNFYKLSPSIAAILKLLYPLLG